MENEEHWEQIAHDAMDAATHVECSPSEYREGLAYIKDLIQESIDASLETDTATADEDIPDSLSGPTFG